MRDNNNNTPPKTHNLLKIAGETKLELSERMKINLLNINNFNLETRYPDYKLEFYKKCNKQFADESLKTIKDIFKWLRKQI